MTQARSKSSAKMAPWWLHEGEEECIHCGQLYIYELEFRCPECDGPCCTHCRKIHAAGYHVCPECVATDAQPPRS